MRYFRFIQFIIIIIIIIGGVIIIVWPPRPEPPCLACGKNAFRLLGAAEILLGGLALYALNGIGRLLKNGGDLRFGNRQQGLS